MRPQNIQRIDHVVICVRPENIHSAAETFTKLLDITFDGPYEVPDRGVILYNDWDSGIEIMTPTNPELAPAQAEFLEKHGEGVFRLVFGFADRDEALDRAESMGIEVLARMDALSWDIPPMTDGLKARFTTLLESRLETVHGVRLNFCEIVASEGYDTTRG